MKENKMTENSLCKINHPNNNPYSSIDSFRVATVREYSDNNGEYFIEEVGTIDDFLSTQTNTKAEFYRLYGVIKRPFNREIFLADFDTIDEAMNVLYYLTGNNPQLISY